MAEAEKNAVSSDFSESKRLSQCYAPKATVSPPREAGLRNALGFLNRNTSISRARAILAGRMNLLDNIERLEKTDPGLCDWLADALGLETTR